jgi:acetyltransferase
VRLHPLNDVDARGMIEGVRGWPLLNGLRGEPRVCVELIEETLLRLSQLVADFEDQLEAIDLNPLIVTASAERSFVVDARILLRESA